MPSPYPKLAGFQSEGTVAGKEPLFAGDAEVLSDSAPALAAIAQWQVCVLLATGITPYVPATHTTAAPDKLVIAHHTAASGQQTNYYLAGNFNHNLLGWPAALDTFAKRKEAVLGSQIMLGHVKPPSA